MVSHFCPNESITLYSFSKIMSPGIRVAAIITPTRWFSALTVLKQAMDLHTNVPMQQLVVDTLNHPEFEEHLEKTRQHYQHRYQTMANELMRLPQDKYRFTEVEGGMFIWLRIPPCDLSALAASAIKQGVVVVPGSEFYTEAPTDSSALRLNFTYCSSSQIQIGISRLKAALSAVSPS